MAELTITSENFDEEVLQSPQPVLIDFWAPWCGPCRMVAPVIEELAKEYEGKVKVGKVNVDEEIKLAQEYGVMSIPSIMLFQNGKVVNQALGARPKEELVSLLLSDI